MKDGFDGVTARTLSGVLGVRNGKRGILIDQVVDLFQRLSLEVRGMTDIELRRRCEEKAITNVPFINERRYMCFELFRKTLHDDIFPGIIKPHRDALSNASAHLVFYVRR